MSRRPPPRRGQRFRILRPHARGGLGAVLSPSTPSSTARSRSSRSSTIAPTTPLSRFRFLIEAQITGGLEHPGIVPVYGLGTHGDGRPYYAMRFIRGDSLKEAIEQFHAEFKAEPTPGGPTGSRELALRKLLRRFLDVCNAIDYAHSRGVIHRDIKPANIIVGSHGETLVVDWGLAKPMGHVEPESQSGERPITPSRFGREYRDVTGQRAGHAGLHEPGAGRGPARPARARDRMSTAWELRSTAC